MFHAHELKPFFIVILDDLHVTLVVRSGKIPFILTRLCSSDSNFCIHNNNYVPDNTIYRINRIHLNIFFFQKSFSEFLLFQQLIKCYFNDDDDDLTRDFKNLSALSTNTSTSSIATLISVPPHYLIRNLSDIVQLVVCVCVVEIKCSWLLALRNAFVFGAKMYHIH